MASCQPQSCSAGSGAQNALVLAAVPQLCYLRSIALCTQVDSQIFARVKLGTSLKSKSCFSALCEPSMITRL